MSLQGDHHTHELSLNHANSTTHSLALTQVTFLLEIVEMLRILTWPDTGILLSYIQVWGLRDIYSTVKTNKDGGAVIRGCKLPTNMVIILMSVDFKISILGVYYSGR